MGNGAEGLENYRPGKIAIYNPWKHLGLMIVAISFGDFIEAGGEFGGVIDPAVAPA